MWRLHINNSSQILNTDNTIPLQFASRFVTNHLTMNNILIVDDDPDILEFVKYNLDKENFKTDVAMTGNEALLKVKSFRPDLILLDVMLPDIDGVETCIKIRENKSGKQPIIAFLTARSEDYSQIAGFEVGADDYITKPIRPRVLLARVQALLKRKTKTRVEENTINTNFLKINQDRREVIYEGQAVHIPKIEFDLLVLLASNPGKIFNREEIYAKIWGNEVFVSDRTLDVHIRKLREKIGTDHIKTIKGVGYGFNE